MSTLAVAFSDPCILLRCLLSCSSGQPALMSLTGKQGYLVASGYCTSWGGGRVSEQNGYLFPSALLGVSSWDASVFSPPEYLPGSLPVSQLLTAISAAAMPLHCEDTCPGSLLVLLVNTGGEEGRDGSSWLH